MGGSGQVAGQAGNRQRVGQRADSKKSDKTVHLLDKHWFDHFVSGLRSSYRSWLFEKFQLTEPRALRLKAFLALPLNELPRLLGHLPCLRGVSQLPIDAAELVMRAGMSGIQ